MQADSSSLFLGMILFWFLSFQYYKRYGKKTAKNLTFLCKVAPVYGKRSPAISIIHYFFTILYRKYVKRLCTTIQQDVTGRPVILCVQSTINDVETTLYRLHAALYLTIVRTNGRESLETEPLDFRYWTESSSSFRLNLK